MPQDGEPLQRRNQSASARTKWAAGALITDRHRAGEVSLGGRDAYLADGILGGGQSLAPFCQEMLWVSL
jgi:hypothetical protein